MRTSELAMDGLPGDNPLGFMAALGALVVTTRLWPGERTTLHWCQPKGVWRPVLQTTHAVDAEGLVAALHATIAPRIAHEDPKKVAELRELTSAQRDRKSDFNKARKEFEKRAKELKLKRKSPEYAALRRERLQADEERIAHEDERLASLRQGGDETLAIGENLKIRPGLFASHLGRASLTASPKERRTVDLFAAFGSEVVLEDDNIGMSRMSKQNGNSTKNMLADLRSIARTLTLERLTAALLRVWDYADEKWGLGWDPRDVKPFAYQAENPKLGAVTMHGANLLAYEALGLLPVVVRRNSVETTGTSLQAGRRWAFSWPLWERPLPVSVVRSLLAHPAVHLGEVDVVRLRALGVGAVFRAEHFSFNKSPRFKPASPF